jgi:hypothetical protein
LNPLGVFFYPPFLPQEVPCRKQQHDQIEAQPEDPKQRFTIRHQ